MIDGIRLDLSHFGGPKRGFLRIYTVKAGDTAASIARRIPVKKPQSFLLAINGLNTPDEVKAGQRLKIVLAS
jgi:LysM repeat protein